MSTNFIDKRLSRALEWAVAQSINRTHVTTPPNPHRIRHLYLSSTHGRCDRTMRVYDTILTKHAFGRWKLIAPGVVVSYN